VKGGPNHPIDEPSKEESVWILEGGLKLGGTDEDFRRTSIHRLEDAFNRLLNVCISELI
jgi:hypothetical protein